MFNRPGCSVVTLVEHASVGHCLRAQPTAERKDRAKTGFRQEQCNERDSHDRPTGLEEDQDPLDTTRCVAFAHGGDSTCVGGCRPDNVDEDDFTPSSGLRTSPIRSHKGDSK